MKRFTAISVTLREEAALICQITASGTGAALEVARAAINASPEAIELALDTQSEVSCDCGYAWSQHDADCWRVQWAEGEAMLRNGWRPE